MTDIQKENKSGGKVPNRGSVNFPRLRFPEFEGEYRQYSFEDLFLFSTGKNIKQNEASPEYETPCVRYGELYHLYNEIISEVVNKTNLDKSDLTFSIGNEILLPSAGEDPLDIGSASALTIKGVAIGRTINILRPLKKNLYSNIYVSYYINEKLKKKISTLAKGVSISNVYNSDLKILNALLPSISEQQKISSFLLLINSRIQTQNKIIEQLETLIKGLSEKLFSQEIRFKEFTDKWELKKLGDISTITTGSSNREDSMLNGEYTFFDRSQDIRTSSRFLFDKEAVIVPGEGQEFIPKYFIGKFDLHQRTYAIFDFSGIYGKYLYYHLLNDDKYLQSQAVGSTVKSLRLPMLQSMPIKSPCLDEQTTIANFLSVIETKIQTEKNILDKYHSQKQYLLQNLFI